MPRASSIVEKGLSLLGLCVLSPLALLAETWAFLLLLDAPRLDLPLGTALVGLHLGAAVLLGEAARLRFARGATQGRQHFESVLLLTLALPLFGPLLGLLLVARPARGAIELDGVPSPMEARRQQAEAQRAAEVGLGAVDAGVEAIGDALRDEQKSKRLGAVEALRALENREAVALLGRSLNNTVFEVRFHAVEALAGIGKKHSQRIADAQSAAEGDPSAEKLTALGRVYYEYAALEMEEESIQQHLYRSATTALRRARQAGAVEHEALLMLAASLERIGAESEAASVYDELLELAPESYPAWLGRARLLYKRRELAALPEVCRRALALGNVEPQHREALALWANTNTSVS